MKMPIQVGINGFGRIGRNVLRAALGEPEIDIVAVNDITDSGTLAHLLKYDSVLGSLDGKVDHSEGCIHVNGSSIRVFKVKEPWEIDWSSFGVQIVVESTGKFNDAQKAREHLKVRSRRSSSRRPPRMKTSPSCWALMRASTILPNITSFQNPRAPQTALRQ